METHETRMARVDALKGYLKLLAERARHELDEADVHRLSELRSELELVPLDAVMDCLRTNRSTIIPILRG